MKKALLGQTLCSAFTNYCNYESSEYDLNCIKGIIYPEICLNVIILFSYVCMMCNFNLGFLAFLKFTCDFFIATIYSVKKPADVFCHILVYLYL